MLPLPKQIIALPPPTQPVNVTTPLSPLAVLDTDSPQMMDDTIKSPLYYDYTHARKFTPVETAFDRDHETELILMRRII
jgi:hypothetical protein